VVTFVKIICARRVPHIAVRVAAIAICGFFSGPASADDDVIRDEPAIQAAVARLRALGANAVTPRQVRIENVGQWHGTEDDVLLVNQLPDLAELTINFKCVDADVVSELKLPRLDKLTLYGVSDEALAATPRLPEAEMLAVYPHSLGNGHGLAPWQLTAVGYRRVAELAGPIKSLHIGWSTTFGQKGIDDTGLAALGQIKTLEKLDIYDGEYTGAGLARLSGLENLAYLSLANRAKLDAADLASLKPIQSLRSLNVSGMKCSPRGFRAVASLEQLEELQFWISQFPAPELQPADVAALRGLKNLQSLWIGRWDGIGGLIGSPNIQQDALLANSILNAAGQIPTMTSITIHRIGVTADGVEALVQLPHLESLSLCPLQLQQRTVAALGNLKELRRLSVTDTQTSNVDLQGLTKCTELGELHLIQAVLDAKALAPLAELRLLKTVDFSHATFHGDVSTELRKLAALETLDISQTNGNVRQDVLAKDVKIIQRAPAFPQ